jgi:hypothetical protein
VLIVSRKIRRFGIVGVAAIMGGVLSFGVPARAVAPFIRTISPISRSTGVPVDANLVLTFSEAVTAEEGGIHIYVYGTNVLVETARVGDTAKVSLANEVVTINWANNLAYGTTFYVKIDATAFDNLADESFGGADSEGTIMFTTVSASSSTVATPTTAPAAVAPPAILGTRCPRAGARRLINGQRLVCRRVVTRTWQRA